MCVEPDFQSHCRLHTALMITSKLETVLPTVLGKKIERGEREMGAGACGMKEKGLERDGDIEVSKWRRRRGRAGGREIIRDRSE